MSDVEGVVLYKILESGDLNGFARLRSNFFSSEHSSVFKMLIKYYKRTGKVPTFDNLRISLQEQNRLNDLEAIKALKLTGDQEKADIEDSINALIDAYAQREFLSLTDRFLNDVLLKTSTEIKEGVGAILLELDSKLNTDETILYANQLTAFKDTEVIKLNQISTGISNRFDSEIGGYFEEDLILIGGWRGAGKSLVCANLAAEQYQQGNVVVYFTIEMTGQETYDRVLSILSGVNAKDIKLGSLNREQQITLAKTRADMFLETDHLYTDFIKEEKSDPLKFERMLVAENRLKTNNQIIIVDDSQLTVSSIDLIVQKLKAEHKDNLKLIVIDYLNQVTIEGSADSQYDWKDQIIISKQLKNIARKNKCIVVSPYQIDEKGGTRFAKGILDACDVAMILKADSEGIVFECVKARSANDNLKYKNAVHWETLKIDPVELPEEEPEEKKTQAEKAKGSSDI